MLTPEVEAMLPDVARLAAEGCRLRLSTIEVEGRDISSHLFLAAGGEVSYWLGGFDERWASFHPSMHSILYAIEQSWQNGDTRVDLNSGGQAYKYRFADQEDTLEWSTLVPRGPRSPLVRAELVSRGAGRAIYGRLPENIQVVVRRTARAARVSDTAP